MSKDQQSTTINYLKAGRDVHQVNILGDHHEHHARDGWVTLSDQIDSDALPDAASRFRARCHPGTRKAILEHITTWMDEQTVDSRRVVWLHGSVGLGKSAIADEIAYSSLDRHVASYFFSPRQDKQATSGHLFIKTIVYQLGLRIPKFKELIIKALSEDPVLLSKGIEPLLAALVISPITTLHSSLPGLSPVIIIDGLDQCTTMQTQLDIITKVIGALRDHPFRFLVTSRPEQHLREAFMNPIVAAITEAISLDGYPATDEDIRFFLQQGFEDVLCRRADVMKHVARPWPTPTDLNYFVSKASGQFLYAATVLEYFNETEILPIDQLKMLKSPVGNSFSGLDELYVAILGSCHQSNQGLLQRVLTMMQILHCPQGPEVYEDLLGAQRGLVTATLSKMHSIIRVPNLSENAVECAHYNSRAEYDHTQGLRLRHENFRDFLEVPARSGQYALQLPDESKALVAFVIRELFVKFITDGHPAEDAVPPCRETWGYLKEHLHTHLLNSEPDVLQSVLTDIAGSVDVISNSEYPPGSCIPKSTIYALNTLLTTIAKMVIRHEIESEQRRNVNADHSHWAVDIVLSVQHLRDVGAIDDRLGQLYQKCISLLDKAYYSVLRYSPDLYVHLPALLVGCKRATPKQWVQDMFGDDLGTLWNVPQSTRDVLIHQWESPLWARYSSDAGVKTDVLALNAHFQAFIWDAERSGQFSHSPERVLAAAFRQILKRIFSSAWLLQSRSFEALSFLDKILKSLLASNIFNLPSYPSDDPRMLVLNDLVSMDYCVSALGTSPPPNVASAWQTMLKLLRWLYDRRKEARKQENQDLVKLFQDARDNIYHQILTVEAAGAKGYPFVTIIQPILTVVAPDHPSMSRQLTDAGDLIIAESPTTPDTTPKTTRALPPIPNDDTSQNRVSETLLLFYGVRHSLDSFLKSRERAGALHVQPNAYHTQLAEVCLELCHSGSGTGGAADIEDTSGLEDAAAPAGSEEADRRKPIAQRAWQYHLERAQPTTLLLSLLRTILPGGWLAGGSLHRGSKDKDEVKRSSVKTIINWLKNLAKQPADLVQRWEKIHDELPRRKSGSLLLQRKNGINPMQSLTTSPIV